VEAVEVFDGEWASGRIRSGRGDGHARDDHNRSETLQYEIPLNHEGQRILGESAGNQEALSRRAAKRALRSLDLDDPTPLTGGFEEVLRIGGEAGIAGLSDELLDHFVE
jgi:hypothetical protein